MRETGASEAETWGKVHEYVEEIVPSFNLVSYYRLGYATARLLVPLLYKVSVGFEAREALDAIPRDSVVLYLMNHRSNADYVVGPRALSRWRSPARWASGPDRPWGRLPASGPN
jgi:glycerol-3-phosphate O-acyltransferase